MSDSPLIDSLTAAVQSRPDDVPLRLHLVQLLLDAGRQGEAISHAAQALQYAPDSPAARDLMARAIGTVAPAAAAPPAMEPAAEPGGLDWRAYEEQFSDVVPPRFARADAIAEPVRGEADRSFDIETSVVRLADVGGLADVKRRLELAFLGPLRNPQLRAMFGKSLRGGLLLYGPPGCGKTFLARAVAGEMGARFLALSIVDVLNMWIGNSEKNLHEIFEAARRNAPCVVFLDEIDALGHKRSQLHSSAMRTLGNQLLAELDGMEGNNDGVFILAATNAPWDVDAALRRPGRLDRVTLVLPPDPPARAAIIEYHLRQRPIANIDLPGPHDRAARLRPGAGRGAPVDRAVVRRRAQRRAVRQRGRGLRRAGRVPEEAQADLIPHCRFSTWASPAATVVARIQPAAISP